MVSEYRSQRPVVASKLLDRFRRRDILTDDPIFRADLFNSTDTTMEMGIVNIGDGLSSKKTLPWPRWKKATVWFPMRNIQGGMRYIHA
jgi:hypothetical protein